MNERRELRIALVEAMGEDRDELQEDYNQELANFYDQVPGVRVLGMEPREGPLEVYDGKTYRTLRGVLTYEIMASYQEPETDATEAQKAVQTAQEARYAAGLTKVLGIASNISQMREGGKNGNGLDYRKLWELIDRLGDEFRAMGGGLDSAILDPAD